MSWFLHGVEVSGEELRRARLLVRFGIGFGVFCAGFVPILLFVSAPLAATWTGLCSTAMIVSPFALRWKRSIALGSSVLVAAIGLLFFGTSATLGGLSSPTTSCLVIAPVVALFLLGPRPGILWSVANIGFAAALYGLHLVDRSLPLMLDLSALPFLRTAGVVTVVGVILLFLLQYDIAQNAALRSMSRANRRMVEMVSHLEATSAALRKSAAEFDGSDPTAFGGLSFVDASLGTVGRPAWPDHPVPGLTQQMLAAAGAGRAMIDDVHDSIRGMIDQYKLISGRIGEQHKQAGIIADMVHSIDSISNRLDLMALNTAIEAEHAGQAGRRFRLLADDMRRLAERVLNESRSIKVAITKVQQHTAGAIEASRAGRVLTDEGAANLELMSRAFDDIYELVERSAAASKQITGDTVAQLATIYALVNASLHADDEAE